MSRLSEITNLPLSKPIDTTRNTVNYDSPFWSLIRHIYRLLTFFDQIQKVNSWPSRTNKRDLFWNFGHGRP